MRIGTAHISDGKHGPVTAATIGMETETEDFPEELWFELRDGDTSALSTRADPFLIGMLPIAMRLGNDIHVEGPVSTTLAYGLESWQDVLTNWYPKYFSRVRIHYQQLENRRDETRPTGVGSCFSGGLDSYYTLWRHLPGQQPLKAYQLTHALLINGFDQIDDMSGEGASRKMFDAYAPIMEGWGIELLMVTSNLHHFRQAVFAPGMMVRSFGSPLLACAHALGNVFGRFAVSASASYAWDDLLPVGSHLVLDPLLGTDQLQVMHVGAEAGRARKVEALAGVPEIQQSLRVCFRDPEFDQETGNILNCGECEKCIRTISAIDIVGKLDEFTALSHRAAIGQYKRPEVLARSDTLWLKDNLALAYRLGRQGWVEALQDALRVRKQYEFQRQANARTGSKTIMSAQISGGSS